MIWRLDKKGTASFDNKVTRGAFKNTSINFIGNRKIYYVISSLIILLGVGSLFSKGLNYGVDFKGGRTFVVRFDDNVNNEDVRSSLAEVFVDEDGLKMAPEVKTFGDLNQVKVTTKYLIESTDINADKLVDDKLMEGLSAFSSFEVMSSQKVGPTIADDIKDAALWSIIFSLLVIFLYILTIIGYSLNDTVVVFDRIREHLGTFKKKEINTLVNDALNSTLSRTINTSLTTFFVLLIIFLFGGEVIRGFMFALMVGVLVGTYSSLFVASPIMLDTLKKVIDKK